MSAWIWPARARAQKSLRDELVKAAEAVGQEGAGTPHRLHGTLFVGSAGSRRSRRHALCTCECRRTPKRIVASLGGKPVPELQCDLSDHFDKQVRVVLENAGHIDPEKIDEYIACDGYKALMTALMEMTPNWRDPPHHRKPAER